MPRPRSTMPWVERRDGGTWYVFWYDEAKRRTNRLSLRTHDEVEARSRFAAFLAEGSDILVGQPRQKAKGLTVNQALDDYWREHVAAKVIDKVRVENAIRHLRKWFADTPLQEIDIPASRAYAEWRRMSAMGGAARRLGGMGADGTIRRELVALGAAARHALRWKRIVPAELPSIELPAETRGEAPWLTKDEWAKALAAADGMLADFMLVAYYTAGRRASIERLTKFQVDLKGGRINLQAPDASDLERRSNKRRPIVPVFPEIRPTLERLMATDPSVPWVFGAPVYMYRPFHNHMTAIGLADKAHPHILRHSRATHLLQAGVPIYDVARLLGDTVATVERVYGHHSSDYLAATIGAVG
jgi:integrase